MGLIIDFFRFLGFEKIDISKEIELESELEFITELEKHIEALNNIISKYRQCCDDLFKIIDNYEETLTYVDLMLRDK